jgi:hypothetical protein
MAEAESGEGWPRLMAWLRGKREEAQEFVMSGQLSPEEYRVMSARYAMCVETLAQAQMIARGDGVKPNGPATGIMEQIEGA